MADDLDQLDLFVGAEPQPPAEEKKKPKKKAAPKLKSLSRVEQRLIKTSVEIEMNPPEAIAFQHTVLCQTCLPYRDPGADVLRWEREQGAVSLLVNAGEAKDPSTGKYVQQGLPFGPTARLILAHLNTEALKTASPVIEVEDSLTAFVRRMKGGAPNGAEVRKYKDHLTRLATATIRMAIVKDHRAFQVNGQVVDALEIWLGKDERQRVLWPSTIELNPRYWQSLQNHAVPLDERALAALAHSAMALDIYTWLSQRLHRVPKGKPQFIPWAAVKEQFGPNYGRMDNFKAPFRVALGQVLAQYQAANLEMDGRGLTLRNSSPPIAKKLYLVNKPVE